jgi:hypothetical protein
MKEISPITIIFGLSSLVIGWLSLFSDLLGMIQLRQIAIVLLILFFYSLNSEEISALEKRIKDSEKKCRCGD